MSEFSEALTKQNDLIDAYKKLGEIMCPMIDVKPSMRIALEHYYSDMIGYPIRDGMIFFQRLKWLHGNDI